MPSATCPKTPADDDPSTMSSASCWSASSQDTSRGRACMVAHERRGHIGGGWQGMREGVIGRRPGWVVLGVDLRHAREPLDD